MRIQVMVLVAAAACSPYSPNLGNTPFLCANNDPKCPDGYTCQPLDMKMVCVQNGTNNDSIATAYQTPVATQRKDLDFTNLAICPTGDKDYYSVQLTATQNIDVTLIYD